MSKLSKLVKSRDSWKDKAVNRGAVSRHYRQELARVKKERDRFKNDAQTYQDRLKTLENTLPAVCAKEDVVFISLQLFLVAHIGFRGVSRVLKVLAGYLGIKKAPCPQTIINWVHRLSIARIQDSCRTLVPRIPGNSSSNGFIFMIDTSIALGAEKILCVLALAADHYGLTAGAPSLQDVHCIAVGVAVSWTGQNIADFLLKVMKSVGNPVALLKDRGTDLGKALKILAQQGYAILSIDDVSHVCANLLKHEYGKHPLFDPFISACGKASQKLKQTILACLAPPKVSTRARFMNLHRLIQWADRLLKLSPVGRAAKGSLLERLRNSFDQLPACKIFISRFLRDSTTLLECQKRLKTRGLSHETVEKCKILLTAIPSTSSVRIGFVNWLEAQLEVAVKLGLDDIGSPITSDTIESLFSVGKTHGVGKVKDAYRIAARLPAMCGRLTKEDVQRVLEITVAEQEQMMGNMPSLTRQRRRVLTKQGSLVNILSSQACQRFELIPGAEKCIKNDKKSQLLVGCVNSDGPEIRHANKADYFSDPGLTGLAANG